MAVLKALLLLTAVIGISYGQMYGDGTVTAEFEVKCDDTHFAVFFNKTALDERTVSGYNNRSYIIKFYGQDSLSCWSHDYDTSAHSNSYNGLSSSAYSSTIRLGVPFTASPATQCGINVFQDSTHIMYNTTIVITYGENPNSMIGREEYDKYNVMCLRNRTIEEKLNGDSVMVDYRQTGMDAANATADFAFSLTHSDMNGAVPSANTYKLGDFIKFKLEMQSVRTEAKSVIQRCWATSDGTANEYALITNRCDMEEGTQWVSSPNNTFHIFRTEAFRYLGVGNTVHVECLVRVCLTNDASATECQTCSFVGGRKRREVTADGSSTTGTMSVVKSPIFYIIDREATSNSNQQQSSSGALSGTNGLIVIILLATLVFVIAAAIIKKVFFTAPAAPVAVTAYQNKAMA